MNLSWLLLLHCWNKVLKNFRPVSNLTYLSKNIERVVMVRLNQQLIQNGLHEVLQSAYKQNYNNETALLKVQNDLLIAIDTYGRAVLILPYYTAATTAWVGNQRCCIRLVQILFEPAETICCYQRYIHPVHNTAGRNNTGISAKFPFLCWWNTAVDGLQAT